MADEKTDHLKSLRIALEHLSRTTATASEEMTAALHHLAELEKEKNGPVDLTFEKAQQYGLQVLGLSVADIGNLKAWFESRTGRSVSDFWQDAFDAGVRACKLALHVGNVTLRTEPTANTDANYWKTRHKLLTAKLKKFIAMPGIDEKLQNMMLAHLDGVYLFTSREDCDELVSRLIIALLEALKQRETYKQGFIKCSADYDSHLGFLAAHGITVKAIPECVAARRLIDETEAMAATSKEPEA
jgi:hypothetical protein